jgi:hypothetical protein
MSVVAPIGSIVAPIERIVTAGLTPNGLPVSNYFYICRWSLIWWRRWWRRCGKKRTLW